MLFVNSNVLRLQGVKIVLDGRACFYFYSNISYTLKTVSPIRENL